MLAGVTDPKYQGETGGKEVYVCNRRVLRAFLVSLCPEIQVNESLQRPNLGRATDGPDPSGMKVWASNQARTVTRLATAESKGNTE